MKVKLLKKPMAVLLAFIMLFGLLPVSALADGESGGSPTSGLTALAFNGDSDGKTPLPMTPSFSNSTTSYTVTMPDYDDSLNCYSITAANTDKAAAYRATDRGPMQSILTQGSLTWLYGVSTGAAGADFDIHTGANPSYNSITDASYKVKIQRQVTLSGLNVDGASLYPAFNPGTQDYTVGVLADATKASVTATAYGPSYSLTIAGNTATSGTKTDVALNGSGNTTVQITVSFNGAVSTTYNLTLIKMAKDTTPVIYQNPLSATYYDTEKNPAPLTVAASSSAAMSYQWYSNTENNNTSGTEINSATSSSYTPAVSNVGTSYYYCNVKSADNFTYSVNSPVAVIIVNPDPTPTVVLQDNTKGTNANAEYDYSVGDTAVTLKASVTSSVSGGIWSYQWNDSDYDYGLPTTLTYKPATTKDSSIDYTCTARYFVNGQLFTKDSNSVTIKVTATSAQPANITLLPASQDYLLGGTVTISPLTVTADSPDGGTLSYQWYSSADNSNSNGTKIDGATQSSYTPKSYDTANTTYYYCEITNTVNSSSGSTYTKAVDTAPAAIIFGTLPDLGGTWQGTGTANDPYQITSAGDLTKLCGIVNKGVPFEGYCFKLTANITLPSDWVPMGTIVPGHNGSYNGVYMWPFSGTIDGNNTTLTVPDGGLPLLGYVRHATVKNLNIMGTHIAGYGLVNNYDVDYGPTGNYGSCNVDTINIYNVTLKSGTQTLKAGFIGGYASGINTVNIFGCTVESGVTIGYNKDQSDIGSFAGDFNGNIENSMSSADVFGINNVGGLAGFKGQSMGSCAVRDSAFHGTASATGNYAGGIVGSGYNVFSAPNSPCVTIQNCYCDGNIAGADYVGGIFGGEPIVKQCWANGIGYIQNNYFSGILTSSGSNVGGIIGYMTSLDRYNVISNNYYLEGKGASKGIGNVGTVDKTTTTQYNRSDDPTGADADKLAKSVSSDVLKSDATVALLNNSINGSGNWVSGTNGPIFGTNTHLAYLGISGFPTICHGGDPLDTSKTVVTAVYSDGTSTTLNNKDVSFTGFDSTFKGYCTVMVTYQNHNIFFEIQIANNADYSGDITTAKAAVSGAAYSYSMSVANTSSDVKALIEKQIAALNMSGVTATVAMGNFTAATSSKAGSFTATVTLTKGTGTAQTSDSTTINGVITSTSTGGGSDSSITVTFRLIGSTRSSSDIDLSSGKYMGASYVTWIPTTSYTIPKDSTMYDLFLKATGAAGLSSIGADSNYIKTINAPSVCGGYALSEFTNGTYSGWMYTVNGLHPGVGLKDYTLSNGAVVVWHYIDDYRYEDADWVSDPAHPSLGNASTWSKWLQAADTAPTSGSTSGDSSTQGDSSDSSATTLNPAATASNSVASVSVSESDMTSAISAEKKNGGKSIVIAPKIIGDAKKVSVELPKTSIASVSSGVDTSLTVKTPVGSVTLPSSVLSSISTQAAGDTVTVSLNTVETLSLTQAQQNAVGSNAVYDISVMSGGSRISTFGNGTISISLPYTLKSGEDPANVTIWYLNDAGQLQQMACSYDKSTGLATFTTPHLSYYVVGYTAAWTNTFGDVQSTDWFFNAVKYVSQKSLMSGTSSTVFDPNTNMTRAMLATVLYRMEGKPTAAGIGGFTDVQSGQWYSDAVAWASTNKIVNGYGGGLFGTNDNVTREQMATILMNYAKYKKNDVTKTAPLNVYADAAHVDTWATDAMEWAVAEGLITGTTSTTLKPDGNASRAQVATILMRFAEKFAD